MLVGKELLLLPWNIQNEIHCRKSYDSNKLRAFVIQYNIGGLWLWQVGLRESDYEFATLDAAKQSCDEECIRLGYILIPSRMAVLI